MSVEGQHSDTGRATSRHIATSNSSPSRIRQACPLLEVRHCCRALDSTLMCLRQQQCREGLSSARHSQGSQRLPFLGHQCHASIKTHAGPGSHQRTHPEPAQHRVLLRELQRTAQSAFNTGRKPEWQCRPAGPARGALNKASCTATICRRSTALIWIPGGFILSGSSGCTA